MKSPFGHLLTDYLMRKVSSSKPEVNKINKYVVLNFLELAF